MAEQWMQSFSGGCNGGLSPESSEVSDARRAILSLDGPLDDPARWKDLRAIRETITKIGAEIGWEDLGIFSHQKPVSFDEPTLGIIGMWRQGGGANPHFCLALGETMLRVGQRYLAWSAFERANRLADRFWPDPVHQQFLRVHCKKRQQEIEESLLHPFREPTYRSASERAGKPVGEETIAKLRTDFEKELAFGENFQKEYQQYEAAKIAAGLPISDEHFFDEFYAVREPIASPIGEEESFIWVPREKMRESARRRGWAWGLLGAGLASMTMALLIRWRARRVA